MYTVSFGQQQGSVGSKDSPVGSIVMRRCEGKRCLQNYREQGGKTPSNRNQVEKLSPTVVPSREISKLTNKKKNQAHLTLFTISFWVPSLLSRSMRAKVAVDAAGEEAGERIRKARENTHAVTNVASVLLFLLPRGCGRGCEHVFFPKCSLFLPVVCFAQSIKSGLTNL